MSSLACIKSEARSVFFILEVDDVRLESSEEETAVQLSASKCIGDDL